MPAEKELLSHPAAGKINHIYQVGQASSLEKRMLSYVPYFPDVLSLSGLDQATDVFQEKFGFYWHCLPLL